MFVVRNLTHGIVQFWTPGIVFQINYSLVVEVIYYNV